MKLRTGGVAPHLTAWAKETGMKVLELQICLRQANKARIRMLLANIRLVIPMSRRYQHTPVDLEDLIQEA